MTIYHCDPGGSSLVLDFKAAGRLIGSLLTDGFEADCDPDLPQIQGYSVNRLLARGGGGHVYLATHHGSGKHVALKLLNRSIHDRAATERAWRELDVLSDLCLTGIPPVEDFGVHEDRMFIVTAHVEGLTLADHCTHNALDRRARVALLAQVADCAQQFHEHGVIHRDIKPDNIIINRNGQPIIIDFGIASLLTDNPTETLTQDGTPIGTVAYMAPEQARGDRQHTSTRSDVYGLGATACLILTAKTPHDVTGPLAAAIGRVANDPPRNPIELDPTLDRGLASILARAIASSPQERYPSAAALAEDFRRWLRNEPIEWQRPNWLRTQKLAWKRDRRAFLTKLGVAMLIMICISTTVAAVVNAQTAQRKHLLAEEAIRLKEEADRLKLDAIRLKEKETQSAELWETRARQQKDYADRLTAREQKIIGLRHKQMERVNLAIEQGALFEATLVLQNLAEDIQAYAPDDKEILSQFVTVLNDLIETAKKQQKTQ